MPLLSTEEDADADGWVVVLSSPHLGDRLLREGTVRLPTLDLDRNLGMEGMDAVQRQLRVDLPRSVVRLRGLRTTDPRSVMNRSRFPRICTQASLAPPVEWLMRCGVVAHELGAQYPLVVDVYSHDHVCVRKRLGVRADAWEGVVSLAVDARRDWTTVRMGWEEGPRAAARVPSSLPPPS